MNTNKHEIQRKKTTELVFLISVIFFIYLITLPLSPLWLPHETKLAEISREMLTSGDWIIPRVSDFSFFGKPFAGYWLNSLSQWILGHNNAAVRACSALATILTALIVFRMSMQVRQHVNQALTATLVYISTLFVYGIGTSAILDPVFTFWVTLSNFIFWLSLKCDEKSKSSILLFTGGIVCGLAFLTNGFPGIIFPLIILSSWCIFFKKIKYLIFSFPFIFAGAMISSLPWSFTVYRQAPDFWNWFIRAEHIRIFLPESSAHSYSYLFYIPVIFVGMLPWAGTFPATFRHTWSQVRNSPVIAWIAISVVVPLIFMSLSGGKVLTYILPCLAPLAVLTARMLFTPGARVRRVLQFNSMLNTIAGFTGVMIITGVLAPWGMIPVYTESELIPLAVATFCFALWAAFSVLSLRKIRYALLVSLCPFAIGVLSNFFIPHAVVYSNQPQPFLENIRSQLKKSEYIVVQNADLASAVAWELKRSDIILFSEEEPMSNGHIRKKINQRLIHSDNFSQWLQERRLDNDVSLLLYISEENLIDMKSIPVADNIWRQGKFMLLHYIRQAD